MRHAPLHRQRGVAVIIALLLTTLAITIVASQPSISMHSPT